MQRQLARIMNTRIDLDRRAQEEYRNDPEGYRQRRVQNSNRVDRAIRKELKYSMNMRQTKRGTKDLSNYVSLANNPRATEDEVNVARETYNNRQYSRRQYMGLNGG